VSVYAPRIKAARAFAGLTQEQLADELGVAVKTVKRKETGVTRAHRRDLIAIARACDVPLVFLEQGWDVLDQEGARP
jgi:transcriptional regulator with XRE-family HTH domain